MKWIILFLIIINISTAVAQNCGFSVSANNFLGTLQNTTQAVAYTFSVSRRSNSNNCKNFRAFISKGSSPNYNRQASSGNNTIPYNLYSDSSLVTVLKDYPDAMSAGEFISGELPARDNAYSFQLYVKLADLNSVFTSGSGYFGDSIQISFYNVKSNGTLDYQNTAYVYYQFIVPRYAELSLVPFNGSHDPTSTQYTMNFGNLVSSAIRSATLNIKGNVGFGVHMASQNGSNLKNGISEVPYQISVGPTGYVSLSNPGQSRYMFQRNNSTSPTAESYPVNVRLGTVPVNAQTGDYQDVITVTVTAY